MSSITCQSNYDIKGLNIPETVELVRNFSNQENAMYHFTRHLDQSKLKEMLFTENYVTEDYFKAEEKADKHALKKASRKYGNCKGFYFLDNFLDKDFKEKSVSAEFIWLQDSQTSHSVYMSKPNGYIKILQFEYKN